VGLAEARRQIDEGLCRSRWERATPAQKDLMRALAAPAAGRSAPVADIAKQLGKRRNPDISVARNELRKMGFVYAPERGLHAFTVPGVHEFVERQPYTKDPR
jgi:hypothetical protein